MEIASALAPPPSHFATFSLSPTPAPARHLAHLRTRVQVRKAGAPVDDDVIIRHSDGMC